MSADRAAIELVGAKSPCKVCKKKIGKKGLFLYLIQDANGTREEWLCGSKECEEEYDGAVSSSVPTEGPQGSEEES